MKRATSTNKSPKAAAPSAKRIVIVDDHPLFRHGLTDLISSNNDFAVCGEAGTAPEALTVVRKLKPDLVIVDLGLKGPSGIELTKSLRAEFPKLLVLILSMHDEPTYAVRSLRAGATDFLLKPFDQIEVLLRIGNLLEMRRLHIQLDNQRAAFEDAVRTRTAELREAQSALERTISFD